MTDDFKFTLTLTDQRDDFGKTSYDMVIKCAFCLVEVPIVEAIVVPESVDVKEVEIEEAEEEVEDIGLQFYLE